MAEVEEAKERVRIHIEPGIMMTLVSSLNEMGSHWRRYMIWLTF